jgi:hypothetical protein
MEAQMARAKITYVYNPDTGKREWRIDYESLPDATMHEHESRHRELVRELIGPLEGSDVDVDRGGGQKAQVKPADEKPERGAKLRKPS